MRNTYHTLPEDTALFDRLRHRAYAYKIGCTFRIVGVKVQPAFGFVYYATSADIEFWDIALTYSSNDGNKFTVVRPALTRPQLESLYRSTDRATRYYAGGVE